MKHAQIRRSVAEEEESAFVSMTDMTVSVLFIVIILLAFFARFYGNQEPDAVPRSTYEIVKDERDTALSSLERVQAELELVTIEKDRIAAELSDVSRERDELRAEVDRLSEKLLRQDALIRELRDTLREKGQRISDLETKLADALARIAKLETQLEMLRRQMRDPLENYIAQADATRIKVLKEIEARLKVDFPELEVKVNERNGALQFKGEGLFGKGARELLPAKRAVMQRVGTMLNEILPCYTFGDNSSWQEGCNPAFAVIEAIQIEGHTDSEGGELYNLRLSNDRAVSAFSTMTSEAPGLISHLNLREQPVISVAGYGEYRPIASNQTRAGEDENRRIDLRIIMFSPASTEQIDDLKSRLHSAAGGGDETQ
ncbi:OmpA family protein [Ruegeria atlantica]|uniref:Inner membrane lipoprotein YiaD n=1 Tax=Ruegeria atlantica TaxID=81569 RepID=A0A0N7LPX3_9RHOB|nr:OmpA family protein [Ruegeria atlantica]CUH46420.1 Inner membrane lipoprotein YiaD precursor [Ruegeria atlantica]